jgi:hypothetical protein
VGDAAADGSMILKLRPCLIPIAKKEAEDSPEIAVR